jgi:phosphoribosylanthranilate isomerase
VLARTATSSNHSADILRFASGVGGSGPVAWRQVVLARTATSSLAPTGGRNLVAMRVKFCGITRLADAREAARLGAWAIGLNHYPRSPRYCEPEAAVEIAAELRRRLEVVGVFVDPTLDHLAAAAEDGSLSMIQLHGREGPAFCREAARRTGCKVIKALRVRSTADVIAAEAYRTDFHLLDAHRPGRPGGTGESFDWELLDARRSRVPLILAGGLTPANVADAVAVARPFAVDVASGVEARPGIKDHALMADFAERAQSAASSMDREAVTGAELERRG